MPRASREDGVHHSPQYLGSPAPELDSALYIYTQFIVIRRKTSYSCQYKKFPYSKILHYFYIYDTRKIFTKTGHRFKRQPCLQTKYEHPVSRVLFRLHGGNHLSRPAVTCRFKRHNPEGSASRIIPSLFGLAPCGVYLASQSPDCWCALTAPFHPYLPKQAV